jgi:hypothetical protein
MSRGLRATLWIAIASSVLLGQALLPATVGSLLWNSALDAGHLVLFAAFAIVVFMGIGSGASGGSLRRYGISMFVVVVVAGLTEFIQVFGERHAESSDFIRDLLGGGAALCVAASIDAGVGGRSTKMRWVRGVLILVAIALMAGGLETLFRVFQTYRQRDEAFPVVCDFDSAWTGTFLDSRNLEWELVSAPTEWSSAAPGLVARLSFAVAEYPGLIQREPFPDWTGYDRLEFELYSDAQTARRVAIRVNDLHHDNRYSDRFNRALTVSPGINRFSILLEEVRDAPQGRAMDMRAIHGIAVFASSPEEPFSIYLDGFRLTRD